jgi:ribosomal protein S18 acetylase RimI-like enzyme
MPETLDIHGFFVKIHFCGGLFMEITIARMSIDDYDESLQLWKKIAGIRLRKMDSKEQIQAYLRRNPGLSFTVRHQQKLVGTIICGHDGRRSFIQHLVADPEFQHLGIGRMLVNYGCAALKAEGLDLCHLFVLNENHRAIEFWEKLGWRERHDIKMLSTNLSDKTFPRPYPLHSVFKLEI